MIDRWDFGMILKNDLNRGIKKIGKKEMLLNFMVKINTYNYVQNINVHFIVKLYSFLAARNIFIRIKLCLFSNHSV